MVCLVEFLPPSTTLTFFSSLHNLVGEGGGGFWAVGRWVVGWARADGWTKEEEEG